MSEPVEELPMGFNELIGHEAMGQIIDDLPQAVLVCDEQDRLLLANRSAAALFRYQRHALIGRAVRILYADQAQFDQLSAAQFDNDDAIGTGQYRARYRRQDQSEFEGETLGGRLAAADGQSRLHLLIVRDVSTREASHRTLTRLHRITSDPHLDFAGRCRAILQLGCEYFGMPTGVISRIEEQRYEILHVIDPTERVQPGDVFPLTESYCCHALEARGAFSADGIGRTAICDHPSYRRFGLEAYIGDLLQVDGRIVGSINFTSPVTTGGFTHRDMDLIKMFAEWLSHEIARENSYRTLQAAHRQLRDIATLDELTGVGNRRMLTEVLDRELQHSARRDAGLCVVMLDIDHFKAINDAYGHAGGDVALQEFAGVLKESVRGRDFVGRWGGEEFMLVLPRTSLAGAGELLARLLAAVRGIRIEFEAGTLTYTASAGVCSSQPGDTALAVVQRADRLLYDAKNGGRDQFVLEQQAATR